MESPNELLTILPALIIGAGALVVMLADAFHLDIRRIFCLSAFFSLIAVAASLSSLFGPQGESFHGLIFYGGMSAFGEVVVTFGTFFTLLLSRDYLFKTGHNHPEVITLILFSAFGMLILTSANSLITLFLGIEAMSIPLYVLAGIVKNEKSGIESALKYFLLGAFATGFLLYGIALLYGASGSAFLTDIAASDNKGLIYWAGVSLLLVGFFFKISIVPFHMWTPDVYQGAPTPITGFMATASKTAAFIALLLVLSRALPDTKAEWGDVFWFFSIVTMVGGNLLALVQENIKRMLAYSSIAHAGYLLIGFAAGTEAAYSAILFYLWAYTLMNLGAFGVVAFYEWHKGYDFTKIKNYAGLGFQQPLMGVLFSIFLFSMIGIPPFAGFIGKYRVFAAGVQEGLIGLVIVGVLATAASVFYYLRVLVVLYMKESEDSPELVKPSRIYLSALVILALLTIYFGLQPGALSDFLGSLFTTL